MPDTPALINLGNWSEPATVLVKKISNAIGGIFEPLQIKRIAQAEAEADRIKAVSQIEISEIQRRALQRFVIEETNKQQNIESITQKALPLVSADADPTKVEDDWITNFFDKCRLISDDKMQTLWSKILSGEANSPGKFSKRTVDLVASLDKYDADLFSKLCSVSFLATGQCCPLIYGSNEFDGIPRGPVYEKLGLNFNSLSHLDSIGLIQFNPVGFFRLLPKRQDFNYFDISLTVVFNKPNNNKMRLGLVLLTRVGTELGSICHSEPCEGFVEFIFETWKTLGYTVER